MRNTERLSMLGIMIRGSSFLVLLLAIFIKELVSFGVFTQVIGMVFVAIALKFKD